MNDQSPIVSVVMAIYNSATYLDVAIQSILNQSLKDIELILVDDGSTDLSRHIMASFAARDSRVRVVVNAENQGLASSLNIGIRKSRGAYVARMDGDDFALPRRLEMQRAYMDANPSISVCGTAAEFIGFQSGVRLDPLHHEDIRASLLFYTPIIHPSVMFRKADIADIPGPYEEGRQRVEDLELWSRLIETKRFSNLPEALVQYRVYNPASVSKRAAVIAHGNAVRKLLLERLVPSLTKEQLSRHLKIVSCLRNERQEFLDIAAQWLRFLLESNSKRDIYAQDALQKAVAERWWRLCKSSTEIGPSVLCKYYAYSDLLGYRPGAAKSVGMWIKCIVSFRGRTASIHDIEMAFLQGLPEDL